MDAAGLPAELWLLIGGIALLAVIACLAVVAQRIEYAIELARLRRELREKQSRMPPVEAAKSIIARKAA